MTSLLSRSLKTSCLSLGALLGLLAIPAVAAEPPQWDVMAPGIHSPKVGGPYFKQLESGLFYPSFLERDGAQIARSLGLSEEEQGLIEAIIDRYVRAFEAQRLAVQAQLAQADAADARELSDWGERQAIRARAKARMRSTNSNSNPYKLLPTKENTQTRLESVYRIIQEEIALAGDANAPLSKRTKVMNEWSRQRSQLYDEIMEEFELVRGLNAAHWDAIVRALRRINTVWRSPFYGEETDLDLLLQMHLGADMPQYLALAPELNDYAIAYDEALQHRNRTLADTTPLLLDARDRKQIEEVLRLASAQIDARAQMVDLNLSWLDRLVEAMDRQAVGEADGASFRAMALKEIFPDLHRGDPPAATVDRLLAMPGHKPVLREQLADLRNRYQGERIPWRIIAIELMPDWERDRLKNEVESNAAMMVYTGWMNGISEKPHSLEDWRTHLETGWEVDEAYLREIQALVGRAMYEQVPPRFRSQARSDYRRGPVPSSQKQSLNVVYWEDLMKHRQVKGIQ